MESSNWLLHLLKNYLTALFVNMNPIIKCIFAICFFQHILLASVEIDLIHDEDYIPFYAILEKAVDTDIGRLDTGQRVVVIRPVDSSHIRVNVSRKGTTTIPVDVTNLASEISKIKGNMVPNLEIVPRMSFFIANRIVSGESNWKITLRGDRVKKYKRWILLYGDASLEFMPEVVSAASDHYNKLSDADREITLLVYMDVTGVKKSIQELADMVHPSIQCMPGYLSQAYARSFDHIDDDSGLPQIVEVASSGRILHHAAGVAEVKKWLQHNL